MIILPFKKAAMQRATLNEEDVRKVQKVEETRKKLANIPIDSVLERCNIIDKNDKHVFCHIPKTAGLSFASLHISKNIGHDKFSRSNYKEFLAFSVVRDPYTRCISAYRYLLKGGCGNSQDLRFQQILLRYKSFEEFMKHINLHKKRILHFKPQCEFITSNKQITVDIVFRFEKLYELSYLFPSLTDLPKHNITNSAVEIVLSQELKDKIYNAYTDDFKIFKYER